MKRYEVIIEETVNETFCFEIPDNVDIFEYVRQEYYRNNIVLSSGECCFRQMLIHSSDDNLDTDWMEF